MKTLILLTATILRLGLGTAQARVEDYTPEQIKGDAAFQQHQQRHFQKKHVNKIINEMKYIFIIWRPPP